MNLLIVDTETTGLDPKEDLIIEVGCVLYSVDHQAVVSQVSTLVGNGGHNPCESVNRIPSMLLADRSLVSGSLGAADAMIAEMRSAADYYVAHNAEFDAAFLGWHDREWLCTCFDFKWPTAHREGGGLINLALEHGVAVSAAHRALIDCQLIAAVFDRTKNLEEMVRTAARPKATFRALVSYDDRQLAKDAGFKWDPAAKQWKRRMAVEDARALPFQAVEVEA